MAIVLKKWSGENGQRESLKRPYIRFGGNFQLSLSTSFVQIIQETEDLTTFNVYVDRDNRMIGLRFERDGEYDIKRCPAQFGMTSFYRNFKPVLYEHIHIEKKDGMWIGNLDRN